MVKAGKPVRYGKFPQNALPGMPERGMPEIMSQCDSLSQILIQAQGARDRPGNLRDLQRVSQARPRVIALRKGENLRLVFQAAEGFAVYYSVAVTLKGGP
jgi:hypothetical protein